MSRQSVGSRSLAQQSQVAQRRVAVRLLSIVGVDKGAEVVKRLQEVVDSIQVRELTKVIRMLGAQVFDTTQQRFYVLIDGLDENWVDDHFRFRLIKALIETVNEVNQNMKGVKVVVAIRRMTDVLVRPFAGFGRRRRYGQHQGLDVPALIVLAVYIALYFAVQALFNNLVLPGLVR